MSLINDALKKAQSMQSPSAGAGLRLASKPLGPRTTPPDHAVGAAAPAPVVLPRSKKFSTPVILALGGGMFLAAIVVFAGVAFFILKRGSEEITGVTQVVAVTKTDASAPAETEGTASTGNATEGAGNPADPVDAGASASAIAAAASATSPRLPGESKPAVQDNATSPDSSVVTADIEPPALVEEPSPAAPLPKVPSRPRDPKLLSFTLTLRVAGIRTGESPKALINDRVYSVGEYISPEHDLRLAKVDTRRLELEDSFGNIYEVRF